MSNTVVQRVHPATVWTLPHSRYSAPGPKRDESTPAALVSRYFFDVLNRADLPRSYSGAFGVAFGFFMSFVGFVLVAYLGLSES